MTEPGEAGPVGISSAELMALLLDDGSFESWDTAPVEPDPDDDYAAQLERARQRSGSDESVITGRGTIRGRPVAVILSEFAFLAGSVGRASAGRIIRAVERASQESLPLLASPASGGTRMQEGTPAFLTMIAIADAIRRHKEAGLAYLVYLRHPTTGGVMASWGSLGHITIAQPGALLGFLGPRVYEMLAGGPFPAGVQLAENLRAHGIVDTVLPPERLAEFMERVLRILHPAASAAATTSDPGVACDGLQAEDTWASIEKSRDPRRPDSEAVIAAADEVVMLHGTTRGESGSGIALALARFGAERCLIIGHRRSDGDRPARLEAGSLRVALRGVRLAGELGVPLVTLIDTEGAELSRQAEEGALAGEIARLMTALTGVRSPSVSVLLGQGSGGGAIALLPADRTIAVEHAWLSPLPPEGASAIIHRTTARAPQMAEQQRVGLRHLCRTGLIDAVVPAHRPEEDAADLSVRIARAVCSELLIARAIPDHERLARRSGRFRALDAVG